MILLSSSIIAPISYSFVLWGNAFAQESDPLGEDIGPPDEPPIIDQIAQKVEDALEEIIEDPPPVSDETSTEEPAVEELPTEEPAVEELPTEEPAVEELPTEEPAVEELPTEEPAVEELPTVQWRNCLLNQ